jgi:steroid 5-alpha reductase family enzyme
MPHLISIFTNSAQVIVYNLFMFLSGLPVARAVVQPQTALVMTDYILGTLACLTSFTAFVADWQGVLFEKRYFGMLVTGHGDAKITGVERESLTRSPWAWSRHLGFLREQVFWVCARLFHSSFYGF